MTVRLIEEDGRPFALLIESEEGAYLVPPIVRDRDGEVIQGREILAAIIETNTAVELPVVEDSTVADLAEIDQRMQAISDRLGVPIGPPSVR